MFSLKSLNNFHLCDKPMTDASTPWLILMFVLRCTAEKSNIH